MKTAVCLVGHMNSFYDKEVHNPILKIIKDLDADVYVCTSTMLTSKIGRHQPGDWLAKGYDFKKVVIPMREGCGKGPQHYGWGINIEPNLVRTYLKEKLGDKLVDIKILDQDIKTIRKNLPDNLWQYQRQSELLKLKECFNMIEEHESRKGFKYDAVIKCRPDVHLHNSDQSGVCDRFLRSIVEKKDRCVVNLGGWQCPKSHNKKAFFYGFCYGDRDSMNKMADIIELKEVQVYTDIILGRGETLCRGAYLEPIVSHHLGANDIRIEYEVYGHKQDRKYRVRRVMPMLEKFKI